MNMQKKIEGVINTCLTLKPADFQSDSGLPNFCDDLMSLPHGLGHVQDYIYGRMKYPSRPTAGLAAISALAAYAMPFVIVDSYGGLGLNEYFMVLAPTGFGKEDLRRAIRDLYFEAAKCADEDREELGNLAHANLSHEVTKVQYAAPASPQALHKILEGNSAQLFMSDEFGEWLAQSATSSHNQATLAYFMELYTSATGTVIVPQSLAGNYQPVKHPRVALFTTSTAERMSEVMTRSHADSGAYNRLVIFVAEQTRIPKKYDGLVFEPPRQAVIPFQWVLNQKSKKIVFASDAWEYFKTHDAMVIEPLKFSDHGLAGRLSEQAIKIAGIIALSDKRTKIKVDDLKVAFRIRESLYFRAKAVLEGWGGLTNEHGTTKAVSQLRDIFSRKSYLPLSKISDYSRAYGKLSVHEQSQVIRALEAEGIVSTHEKKGRITSLICEVVS